MKPQKFDSPTTFKRFKRQLARKQLQERRRLAGITRKKI